MGRMEVLVPNLPLLCRWFKHLWVPDHDTEKTFYEECSRCGSRRAWQTPEGYQPIDTTWIMEALSK